MAAPLALLTLLLVAACQAEMSREVIDMSQNPMENDGFYQGDMVLTEAQKSAIEQRKITSYVTLRWTSSSNGIVVIPYTLTESGTTSKMRDAVNAGIKLWEDATCLDFQKTSSPSGNYIAFDMRVAGACYSSVGMVGGGQRINIGTGCETNIIVAHEIGHAMGLQHEQSRGDRDGYVTILSQNIPASKLHNFDKENTINSIKYDYASIMHYGGTSFSTNGKLTLKTNDPLYQTIIGNRKMLTFRDIKTLFVHYNCKNAYSCGTDNCENEGYLGKTCSCVCPPGTSGDRCQTLTTGYTESIMNILNPQSGRINTAGAFTSPEYPNFPADHDYVQVIESKNKCEEVEVTIDEFDVPTCNYNTFVYITTDGDTSGATQNCGNSISPKVFKGPRIVITYLTRVRGYTGLKGYKGTIKFVPKPGCESSTTATTPTTASTTTPATSTTTPTTTTTTASTTTPSTSTTTPTTTTTTASTTTPSTSTTTPTPATVSTTTPSTTTTTPTTTTVTPSTGFTLINTGASIELKLGAVGNNCGFTLKKLRGNNKYRLLAKIPNSQTKVNCTIPLSTDEPRYLKVRERRGMDVSEIYADSDSEWSRSRVLSSNVNLVYSGENYSRAKKRRVIIIVRVYNNNCQHIARLSATASGTIKVGNSPCEVWFEAPQDKKISLSLSRDPPSSKRKDCDMRGWFWVSKTSSHKYSFEDAYCANDLPLSVEGGSTVNLRSVHKRRKTAPITVNFSVQ